MKFFLPAFLLCCASHNYAAAFNTSAITINHSLSLFADSVHTSSKSVSRSTIRDTVKQKDLVDLLSKIVHHHKAADTLERKKKLVHLSLAPGVGYSLSSGFAALVGMNMAFYTAKNHNSTNLSTASTNITFTSKGQILFPIQTNIWSPGNKYNIVTDWRLLKYPQETFGIGGRTKLQKGYTIDYSYLRFYTTVLRKVVGSFYAGIGYDLDYFYNIKEVLPGRTLLTPKTAFEKYGSADYERAAGITLNGLFDNRDNPLNASRGIYANLIFRANPHYLANKSQWNSVVLDVRKYINFGSSRNILAFWSYNWLTLNGKPPFFDLPSTGGDSYNNTGRGYIQGRFRAKQMIYLESEFRYSITRNGLLGGVFFANAETLSQKNANLFKTINPAFGAGLRVKFNKFSRTNIAIDYGFGTDGSRGLFVNLGEVF